MARIRTIKPEFFFHEGVAQMSTTSRLFFIGLWTQVDREGRCEDGARRLRAQIFPYEPEIDAEGILLELAAMGHIQRYEVDGRPYIQVHNFLKHQRPHVRENKSDIPAPPPIIKKKNENKAKPKHNPGDAQALPKRGQAVPSTLDKGEWIKGKGMDIAPSAQSAGQIQKPLTGIQKVMRAFKEAKGIDADDAEWDAMHFKRFARPAADLLKIFKGDAEAAILYVLKKGGDLDDKQMSSWGLEAVSRAAATDAQVIAFNGEKNGRQNLPMGANLADGPRSVGRIASSGSLVGDALRGLEHAAVHPEGPSDMGGVGDDWSGDSF